MKSHATRSLLAIAAAALSATALATGPTFKADYIFSGSTLNKAWQINGAAEWKASNGTITGTPNLATGGWLVLDKDFQDVAVYGNVHCPVGCKAGFMVRAEKTASGNTKGLFVSVASDDFGPYSIELDAQGKEISRKKLESAIGTTFRSTSLPADVDDDNLKQPRGEFKPGADWNALQVEAKEDVLFPQYNGGNLAMITGKGSIPVKIGKEDARYGKIALYVGGTAPVEIKDFRYKDINSRDNDPEVVSPNYKKIQLNSFYYGWSTAVADFNRDGIQDIAAGPFIWYGPDYKRQEEIYTPASYNPTAQYPIPSMVNLAYDFTGDGWPDLLYMAGNAGRGVGTLYVNPKGENRFWETHVVLPTVGNEETLLKDIDGDGKPEVIFALNDRLVYAKPDPANPTGKWMVTNVSEPGPWGASIGHGLGIGDINGDGLADFANAYGWWEQPAKGTTATWKMHPQAFGRWGASQGGAGGAELAIYDVNGDKLPDVVGPVEGHGFGLAWWEQKRDPSGNITWVTHMIMDNFLTRNAGDVIFTEPHAAAFKDMNGDGIPDMVTGKRALSHFEYTIYHDPDPTGPAVLYVYKVVRNPKAPGGAEFVPELVHNRSGVGSHFVLEDMNKDGTPDIITSGVYGTFVFLNNQKAKK